MLHPNTEPLFTLEQGKGVADGASRLRSPQRIKTEVLPWQHPHRRHCASNLLRTLRQKGYKQRWPFLGSSVLNYVRCAWLNLDSLLTYNVPFLRVSILLFSNNTILSSFPRKETQSPMESPRPLTYPNWLQLPPIYQAGLVTFLLLVTKHLTKAVSGGRSYFGSQFKGPVHYGGKGTAAGACQFTLRK